MKIELAKNERRPAVTLIELLLVISLIGFMAGMLTFALMGAQTDARVARTRGTIQKLNEIVLQQWEEYRYRAVDMRTSTFVPQNSTTPRMLPRSRAYFRMLILRDMMRMEMPDRASDLLFGPSEYIVSAQLNSSSAQAGSYLAQRAYSHRFRTLYQLLIQAIAAVPGPPYRSAQHQQLHVARNDFPLFLLPPVPVPIPAINLAAFKVTEAAGVQAHTGTGVSDINAWISTWDAIIQPSELLYLIVSTANYGGTPALETFRASEIGDPDQDGLLEFVDAWGNPIQWIRWPTGFPSDLNRYAEPDAMDPMKTDWRHTAFAEANRPQTIVPLIVSSGSDEQFGINFNFDSVIRYAEMRQGAGNTYTRMIDPYFVWAGGGPNNSNGVAQLAPTPDRSNQLGFINNSDQATDNITNHDIILEP